MLGAARLNSALARRPLGGQVVFTASDTWIVPEDVTSICVVAVSPGDPFSDPMPGAGGRLAYSNDLVVEPGWSLSVFIDGNLVALTRPATSAVLIRARRWSYGPTTDVGQVVRVGGAGLYDEFGDTGDGGGAAGYTADGGAAAGASQRGGGGVSLLGGTDGGLGGASPTADGGLFGGGAAKGGAPGAGGIRIIWGAGRAYPNTNTGDV